MVALGSQGPAAVVPTKSEEDTRDYRLVTLANGMRALLVSDGDADKSAVSMSVGVGSWCDPADVAGLAHFLEHMIFLGTEKYPEEGFFDKFLQLAGGSNNAYTDSEATNYYFEVAHAKLMEALERFATFFVCPLFTESATEREMKAVDSEHNKNLQNDAWRFMQLERELSDKKHVFNRFATGSLETLRDGPKAKGIDVTKELHRFYNESYSASIMFLAVVGREPLDELEAAVKKDFSPVKTLGTDRPVYTGTPFTKDFVQKKITVVPVRDLRQLTLKFAMDPVMKDYRTKSESLVSHMIGHEGPGSVLSYLKEKRWANELFAGLQTSNKCFAAFMVSVELTEEGLKHTDEILVVIFQYLEMLRNMKPEEWRRHYEEVRDVSAMQFRFKSKESPTNYVMTLTENLMKYDPEDVLIGPFKFWEFSYERLQHFLGQLTPARFRYNVVAQELKDQCKLAEPVYGTSYALEDVSEKFLNTLSNPGTNSALALPHANQFIATDFTIFKPETKEHEAEDSPPVKIIDNNRIECWYTLDTQFKKPKAQVIIDFVTPEAYTSPRNYVLSAIYVHYMRYVLNEFAYDAEISGLVYNLNATTDGLQLNMRGYNQKMHVLFEKIVERFKTIKYDESRFSLIQETLKRSYQNWKMSQPYSLARYNAHMCLQHIKWHNLQYLDAIPDVSVADLATHVDALWRQMFFRVLASGNLRQCDAKAFCNTLTGGNLAKHALFPAQHPDSRVVKLADNHTYIHSMPAMNPDETNSSIVVSLQIGERSPATTPLGKFFDHLTNEHFYAQLRTVETLGYVVYSFQSNLMSIESFDIIVQGARDPEYVDRRIEASIAMCKKLIADMSEANFEKSRESLVALILEKNRTLSKVTNRYWNEIVTFAYEFNRAKKEAEMVKKITRGEVLAYYDEFIAANAPKRRKISSRVVGTDATKTPTAAEGEESEPPTNGINGKAAEDKKPAALPEAPEDKAHQVVIKSFEVFKRAMPLYPNAHRKHISQL